MPDSFWLSSGTCELERRWPDGSMKHVSPCIMKSRIYNWLEHFKLLKGYKYLISWNGRLDEDGDKLVFACTMVEALLFEPTQTTLTNQLSY